MKKLLLSTVILLVIAGVLILSGCAKVAWEQKSMQEKMTKVDPPSEEISTGQDTDDNSSTPNSQNAVMQYSECGCGIEHYYRR